MKKALILLSVAGLSLLSCSKKEETQEEAAAKAMEQIGQAMQQQAQGGQAGENANKTPGIAIPSKTLVTYLPASLSGYTKDGDAEYMDMDMQGTKYSHASQNYMNGDKRIKVSIFDYNFITGLSMAYGMLMNMNMETNTEITRSEKVNGFPGWFQWNKQGEDGSIGVIVKDRVYVVIEADNGVTQDELHAAANEVNLSGIAGEVK